MNDLRQRLGDAPQLTRGLAPANQLSPKQPEPDTCEHIVDTINEHVLDQMAKAINTLQDRLVSVLNQQSEMVAQVPVPPQLDGALRNKLDAARTRIMDQTRWITELTNRINV